MSASRRLIITVDSPTGASDNLPSHSELAEALAQALPKEMWIDHVDDNEGWGVVAFNTPVSIASAEDYRFSDMDTEIQKHRTESAKLNKQVAELMQFIELQNTGLVKKDKRIDHLIEKNDNLVARIKEAMVASGVSVGWGDDYDLTVLEDNASTARSYLDEIIDKLDTIRDGQ
jgi:hypothetical protein